MMFHKNKFFHAGFVNYQFHLTYRSYSQDCPYDLTEKVITIGNKMFHHLDDEDKEEIDLLFRFISLSLRGVLSYVPGINRY